MVRDWISHFKNMIDPVDVEYMRRFRDPDEMYFVIARYGFPYGDF